MDAEEAQGARMPHERLALGAVLVVAALARVLGLEHRSINGGDEPFSLALAQRPFGDMLELFQYEANGTLYSLVLWPLSRISENEWVIRLPALVAGVAAVAALWWAGRLLVGPRAGLIAAALLALNPFAIHQSQNARPFTMVMLFAILSFGALCRAAGGGGRRWWVAYVASTALAAYANVLAAGLLLPAHLVLVLTRRRDALRSWAFAVAATLVAMLPLVALAVESRSRRNALYWLDSPGPREVLIAAQDWSTALSESKPLFALTLLVVAAVVVAAARAIHPGHWSLPVPPAVLAWALLVPALLVLVAQITPAFRSNYAIAALPGLLLAVAACLDRLPRQALAVGLGALLLLGTTAHALQSTREVDEDWRSVAGWLQDERRPGDRVLIDIPGVTAGLAYYDPHFQSRDGLLPVLEWGDTPFPRDVVAFDDPEGYAGRTGPPPPAVIQRYAAGNRRLFVLFAEYVDRLQGDLPNGAAMRWARRNCKVTEHDAVGISAYLVTGCPS